LILPFPPLFENPDYSGRDCALGDLRDDQIGVPEPEIKNVLSLDKAMLPILRDFRPVSRKLDIRKVVEIQNRAPVPFVGREKHATHIFHRVDLQSRTPLCQHYISELTPGTFAGHARKLHRIVCQNRPRVHKRTAIMVAPVQFHGIAVKGFPRFRITATFVQSSDQRYPVRRVAEPSPPSIRIPALARLRAMVEDELAGAIPTL